jgi:hypothetical protein
VTAQLTVDLHPFLRNDRAIDNAVRSRKPPLGGTPGCESPGPLTHRGRVGCSSPVADDPDVLAPQRRPQPAGFDVLGPRD